MMGLTSHYMLFYVDIMYIYYVFVVYIVISNIYITSILQLSMWVFWLCFGFLYL